MISFVVIKLKVCTLIVIFPCLNTARGRCKRGQGPALFHYFPEAIILLTDHFLFLREKRVGSSLKKEVGVGERERERESKNFILGGEMLTNWRAQGRGQGTLFPLLCN